MILPFKFFQGRPSIISRYNMADLLVGGIPVDVSNSNEPLGLITTRVPPLPGDLVWIEKIPYKIIRREFNINYSTVLTNHHQRLITYVHKTIHNSLLRIVVELRYKGHLQFYPEPKRLHIHYHWRPNHISQNKIMVIKQLKTWIILLKLVLLYLMVLQLTSH